jgi:hypothetical protein
VARSGFALLVFATLSAARCVATGPSWLTEDRLVSELHDRVVYEPGLLCGDLSCDLTLQYVESGKAGAELLLGIELLPMHVTLIDASESPLGDQIRALLRSDRSLALRRLTEQLKFTKMRIAAGSCAGVDKAVDHLRHLNFGLTGELGESVVTLDGPPPRWRIEARDYWEAISVTTTNERSSAWRAAARLMEATQELNGRADGLQKSEDILYTSSLSDSGDRSGSLIDPPE